MQALEESNPTKIPWHDYQPSPGDIDYKLNSLMQNFINGNVTIPPPGLSEAIEEFPAFIEQKLMDFTNNGSMGKFVTQLLQSGDNIGSALGSTLFHTADSPKVAEAFRQFLDELLKQNGPMTDDIVRDMVNRSGGWGNNAVSADILMDLKLILQNGDDAALNAGPLDIVNRAYDYAKAH